MKAQKSGVKIALWGRRPISLIKQDFSDSMEGHSGVESVGREPRGWQADALFPKPGEGGVVLVGGDESHIGRAHSAAGHNNQLFPGCEFLNQLAAFHGILLMT